MNNKTYIVWDWNGTLLNDLDVSIHAINTLLMRNDLPPFRSIEHYRSVFRFPIIDYYEEAGFDFTKRPYHELAEEYMALYLPASFTCDLHEGSKEVLHHFHKLGYHQILLSASHIENLREQLTYYDIDEYFDEILGIDDIEAASKISLAQNWIKRKQIDPANVVFIGDSVHDDEVSKACGCESILIANGHQNKDILKKHNDVILSDIRELIKFLKNE